MGCAYVKGWQGLAEAVQSISHGPAALGTFCTWLRVALLHPSPAAPGQGPGPFISVTYKPVCISARPPNAEQREDNSEVPCGRGATGEAGCRQGDITSCPACFGRASVEGLHHLKAHPCRWSQNLTRQKDSPVPPLALLQGTAQTSYRSLCSEEGLAQHLSSLPSNTSRVSTPLPLQINYSRVPHCPSLFDI